MNISRNHTNKFRALLDELLPPTIRDSKYFALPIFRVLFGPKANLFLDFKQKSFSLTDKEMTKIYKSIEDLSSGRITDLNSKSVERIIRSIKGKTVLEVGCGRGYLSSLLYKDYKVTACDIVIDKKFKKTHPQISFKAAPAQNLPFKDNSFDTVICTHTLEHIPDIAKAIKELRRVGRKRLILVVPMQRPYKYTFDLHVHFFPYTYSFLTLLNPGTNKYECRELDGDILYYEDLQKKA